MRWALILLATLPCLAETLADAARPRLLANGNEEQTSDYPFMVYLDNEYQAIGDRSGGCTGTLIASTWILTVAHCVLYEDGPVSLLVGRDCYPAAGICNEKRTTRNGDIARIIVHPNYDSTLGSRSGNGTTGTETWWHEGWPSWSYDIALVQLTQPFDDVHIFPKIAKSYQAEEYLGSSGLEAKVLGFGWIAKYEPAPYLQSASLTLFAPKECARFGLDDPLLLENMLCGYQEVNTIDTSSTPSGAPNYTTRLGDSGAPIIKDSIIFGLHIGVDGWSGVFHHIHLNISKLRGWIFAKRVEYGF